MSFQTEIMLADVNNGLQILETNEKQTIFSKNCIASIHEQKIREAIKNNDSTLMGATVAELYLIANKLGFANMPGGLLLKHNGFMIGRGLITRSGIRSDYTLTIRTETSVLR